jgi:hypothetical protein
MEFAVQATRRAAPAHASLAGRFVDGDAFCRPLGARLRRPLSKRRPQEDRGCAGRAFQDGAPTYNFAVVVDDADMAITHVIPRDDHVNNTPRQINLFHALALTSPAYV